MHAAARGDAGAGQPRSAAAARRRRSDRAAAAGSLNRSPAGRTCSTSVTGSTRKPDRSCRTPARRGDGGPHTISTWMPFRLPLAQGRPHHLRDLLDGRPVHAAALLRLSSGDDAGSAEDRAWMERERRLLKIILMPSIVVVWVLGLALAYITHAWARAGFTRSSAGARSSRVTTAGLPLMARSWRRESGRSTSEPCGSSTRYRASPSRSSSSWSSSNRSDLRPSGRCACCAEPLRICTAPG